MKIPKRELMHGERRNEVWRYGWASLMEGLIVVFSGGFLNNYLASRSALKWLKVENRRLREQREGQG
jgi:hypothetical protein|tara:strand:+ start:166 stop:366 length:201 start_codon:yes stop_codon:yes gene_type:complete